MYPLQLTSEERLTILSGFAQRAKKKHVRYAKYHATMQASFAARPNTLKNKLVEHLSQKADQHALIHANALELMAKETQ